MSPRTSRALIAALRPACSVLFVLASSCASEQPSSVLERYAEALERGDYEAAFAMRDASFRQAYRPSDLSAAPGERRELAERLRLAAAEGEWTKVATLRASPTERVRLVFEQGSWRVAALGPEPLHAEAPLLALEVFFRAVRARRLEAVRELMPSRFLPRYRDDASLLAHLEQVGPRIERAETALRDLGSPRLLLEGDEAEVAYGDGQRARLVREAGRWRVLDLE